ncbi:MAG: MOSC domain-containing protein [Chitinophagales bacterium]|nr:MOSC domain-containing protein [Chitinophagales bacterium]
MYHVSELYIYPVKSLAGISLSNAEVFPRGFKYDRRWVIVNDQNRFLTQRTLPMLTQFGIQLRNSEIVVYDKRKSSSSISFPIEMKTGNTGSVRIWNSDVNAIFADDEVNEWFSSAVEQDVRLAYMPDSSSRLIGHENSGDHIVSFADFSPYHILGEQSFEHLNKKLNKQITINRFRPNIIFTGGNPHDEDSWLDLVIGNVHFKGVKNCGRCKVPDLDPDTGESDGEPSRVLKSYRSENDGVYFGRYLVAESAGNISVGDLLSICN